MEIKIVFNKSFLCINFLMRITFSNHCFWNRLNYIYKHSVFDKEILFHHIYAIEIVYSSEK